MAVLKLTGDGRKCRAHMPILQYFFGVGGALLCLMFVFNAYVPPAVPREQHDIDKSSIHVTATRTGDFVIDHFPAVRADLATAASEAVRQAMAMMPPDEAKQPGNTEPRGNPAPAPRKRHTAQRSPTRLATGDAPSPSRTQPWSNQPWSNNGWSQNWSSGSQGSSSQGSSWGNWNSNWSQNWGSKRWADSR